ncbi:MAG: PAS domain S-box protein [Bacteroidetes bacterium]|nr:MAG: PAS domain S-box protein [Bacteroidota bacterium]
MKTINSMISYSGEICQEILSLTDTAICVTDAEGIFVWVNKAYCDQAGYAESELVGKHFNVQFHYLSEEKLRKLSEDYALIVKNNVVIRNEYRIKLRDKTRRTFEIVRKPISLANGSAGVVGFITDIDSRKEQENDHQLSRNTLRAIYDSSTDVHFLLDKDLNILAFNNVAEQAIQAFYQRSPRKGESMILYSVDGSEEEFVQNAKKALAGESVYVEREMYITSHTPVWWYVSYKPARNEEGDIIGIAFNATNIDRYKRAEEQLMAQNEQLRQIARINAHEIRGPVSAIIGVLDLLNRETMGEENRELFSWLETAVQNLDHAIKKSVSKAEYGD